MPPSGSAPTASCTGRRAAMVDVCLGRRLKAAATQPGTLTIRSSPFGGGYGPTDRVVFPYAGFRVSRLPPRDLVSHVDRQWLARAAAIHRKSYGPFRRIAGARHHLSRVGEKSPTPDARRPSRDCPNPPVAGNRDDETPLDGSFPS